MDDENTFELTVAIPALTAKLAQQNELQEEANGLIRSMISALEATAQELQDLRQHLEKSAN